MSTIYGEGFVADKIREPVLASDFGVPDKYNEEAQLFADWLVAKELERCANLALLIDNQDQSEWLVDAIRSGVGQEGGKVE